MPDDNDYLSKFTQLVQSARDSASDDGVVDLMLEEGDGHKASSRVQPKPQFTLHCHLGKEGYHSFQYIHLDSNSTFTVTPKGHVITLRFCGLKAIEVKIVGLNLRRLYDYIHQHRMPVVRVADRNFAGDHDEIITAIEINPVKEEAQGAPQPLATSPAHT